MKKLFFIIFLLCSAACFGQSDTRAREKPVTPQDTSADRNNDRTLIDKDYQSSDTIRVRSNDQTDQPANRKNRMSNSDSTEMRKQKNKPYDK
jgi:hypothetical protein